VRFRFLLQPGWLALTLVVFVFAASCYSVLAPWQFGRNADQEAQNAALQSSFANQVAPLEQLVPAGGEPQGKLEWRQVRLTGNYLPQGEAMARLRTVQGKPRPRCSPRSSWSTAGSCWSTAATGNWRQASRSRTTRHRLQNRCS